mgnify:CR=1 FL=1
MSDEQDDKPTVVLDISALKEELASKKQVDAIDQDIEFAVHDETSPNISSGNTNELSLEEELEDEVDLLGSGKRKIIFFDYSSQYFSKLAPKLPQENYEFNIITELKELNAYLQSGESIVVIFHYNAAPKAVNQLSTQIKSKFPSAKTIIVAKGLSPDKASAHQKSKAGANAYLSVPFSVKQFTGAIDSI